MCPQYYLFIGSSDHQEQLHDVCCSVCVSSVQSFLFPWGRGKEVGYLVPCKGTSKLLRCGNSGDIAYYSAAGECLKIHLNYIGGMHPCIPTLHIIVIISVDIFLVRYYLKTNNSLVNNHMMKCMCQHGV